MLTSLLFFKVCIYEFMVFCQKLEIFLNHTCVFLCIKVQDDLRLLREDIQDHVTRGDPVDTEAIQIALNQIESSITVCSCSIIRIYCCLL